jgi:hypothetical protein
MVLIPSFFAVLMIRTAIYPSASAKHVNRAHAQEMDGLLPDWQSATSSASPSSPSPNVVTQKIFCAFSWSSLKLICHNIEGQFSTGRPLIVVTIRSFLLLDEGQWMQVPGKMMMQIARHSSQTEKRHRRASTERIDAVQCLVV